MQTYRVTFSDNYVPRTLRAASPAGAIRRVMKERKNAKVADVIEIREPAILSNARDIEDRQHAQQKGRPAISPAYLRASFVNCYFSIEEFLKWSPRNMGKAPTIGDLCMTLRDGLDMSQSFFDSRHAPFNDSDMAGAVEMVAHMAPRVPLEWIERERDEIESDVRRAMCNAAENDYEAQFWEWIVERFISAANDTGAAWAWLDSDRKATRYPADAAYVGFAMSRRAFLREFASEQYRNETRREFMERAEDIFLEHVSDHVRGKIDISDFDERGAVYADPELWPLQFAEYSDVAHTLEKRHSAMRTKLREMIRNRAPLEARAAFVATFSH